MTNLAAEAFTGFVGLDPLQDRIDKLVDDLDYVEMRSGIYIGEGETAADVSLQARSACEQAGYAVHVKPFERADTSFVYVDRIQPIDVRIADGLADDILDHMRMRDECDLDDDDRNLIQALHSISSDRILRVWSSGMANTLCWAVEFVEEHIRAHWDEEGYYQMDRIGAHSKMRAAKKLSRKLSRFIDQLGRSY